MDYEKYIEKLIKEYEPTYKIVERPVLPEYSGFRMNGIYVKDINRELTKRLIPMYKKLIFQNIETIHYLELDLFNPNKRKIVMVLQNEFNQWIFSVIFYTLYEDRWGNEGIKFNKIYVEDINRVWHNNFY